MQKQPATTDATNTPNSWAKQLVDAPAVSCVCPTYGRVHLLEEAVYAFLQQDYPGPKELIILNDYRQQTLVFDHPEVRIINLPRRFATIGQKYQAAVEQCSHDLIFVWHDDDIYLPHRLSYSVHHLDPQKGFFKAKHGWFWNYGQLSGPAQSRFHGGSCWTRELFDLVQGYAPLNQNYDKVFEDRCAEKRPGSTVGYDSQPADVYYLYRWLGTNSYHLNGLTQSGNELAEIEAFVQQQAEEGKIQQGHIYLNPHWQADYIDLVRAYLNLDQPETPSPQAEPEEEVYPPPYHTIPPPPPLAETEAARLFAGTHPAKISVILPASNESVLLERTVKQFVETLPCNSEVIVVDNGSTDGSTEFLRNQEWPDVNLIQSDIPLGVAGARNKGLDAAQGEVIVFADAHIDLPERWWQPIVSVLNQPNVGVVGPGIGTMGKPDHPVAYGQRIAEPNLRLEWLPEISTAAPVPTLGGGFMAIRHETLQQAGAFDAGMPQWGSEDMELCLRYWLLGYEVWVEPSVTILHYFRKVNSYEVQWKSVMHNLLRVAFLHFNQARIARVITAIKDRPDFAEALTTVIEGDVWQRRAEYAARRARDDDWFFEKFKDSCDV